MLLVGVTKAVSIEMGDEWAERIISLDPGVSLDKEDLLIVERVKKRVREKENYIVFGGRPSVHKGLAETLIIFKQISKHFAEIKLIITGRILNKTLILVKKICKRLDIEDKVVFTGFIPREDRFKIIAKAKLTLYPSHEDAFPTLS
jgi:glycosyltransferase involved in cell wall biosynthesis